MGALRDEVHHERRQARRADARVLAGAHAVDLWAESELSFLLTPWAP